MRRKTPLSHGFLHRLAASVIFLLLFHFPKSDAASSSTSRITTTTTTTAPWPTLLDLIFWEDYGDANLCNQTNQAFLRCPDMFPYTCCGVLPPFCGALACNRTEGCIEGTELVMIVGDRDCSTSGAGPWSHGCEQPSESNGTECCLSGRGSNDWDIDPNGIYDGCSGYWWAPADEVCQSDQNVNGTVELRGRISQPCVEASVLSFFDDGGVRRKVRIPQGTMGRTGTMVLERDLIGFRDAVELTRSLGVPYLWIDSLCIIQADPSKDIESHSNMVRED